MTASGRAKGRDPLLVAARLVITVGLVLLGLLVVGMAIGVPSLLAAKPLVHDALARHAGHPVGDEVVRRIGAAMALLAVMAGLAFAFLRQLRRIIDSVAAGDPFAAINAARLTRMGWLTVAIELLSAPVGALAYDIDVAVRGGGHGEFGIGLGGVLMALLLFVLARVFREGTRMRDELEGTV
jgi:hypothetical protein